MEYMTVKEATEKWEMSGQIIRRFCRQERIPGAVIRDGVWVIPANAKRPDRIGQVTSDAVELPPLAKKLVRQKKKKNFHGLYDYVQTDLAYSSSRMASNRLTRGQVETIFKKGKVSVAFEPMKVSDLVEVLNHCVCVDYILDHVEEPLSQKFIKKLHYMLMFGTVDDRMKKVTPGVYRSKGFTLKGRNLPPSESISHRLDLLIKAYESVGEIERNDILNFHVRFEQLCPFDDGNGRIGRLIMFKECLRHNVMPFILDDKRRTRYLEGIRNWERDRGILVEVVMEAQSRFDAQIQLQKLAEHRQNFLPVGFMED